MRPQRRALGTTAVAFVIIIAAVVGGLGASALIRANSSQAVNNQNQPCYVVNGVSEPGVSEITVNGTVKCVAGPPIIMNNDGRIDFRNGTVVDLHANLTASDFVGGSAYDTVVTSNATRFIFNAHGVIAIIYPYQGREVLANGTVRTFLACAYPVSTNIQLPKGVYGNGTVWFTASGGGIVRFYPDGTCSTASTTSVSTILVTTSSPPPSNTTSTTTATTTCYGGALPTNSSSSAAQPSSRVVFNVTQAFDSWNWKSLSTFTVGSYKFDLVGSQNSQTTVYLEPQVFINVTNSQGQTQRMDMTNLGNLNGYTWPPDLSGGPNVLFGGSVVVQWLFPCNGHDVFFEVTTQTLTSTTTVKATSFTYTPTGQVQVDSVWATESPAQNGMQNVTFWVTFTNTGTAPIYAIGGWVNTLSSSIVGNSSVLKETPAVRCPGAIYIVTISHGQNYTVFAPDCSTGFNYQLVHPGSIRVTLQFNWTTNHQETTPFSNSTMISANFAFS